MVNTVDNSNILLIKNIMKFYNVRDIWGDAVRMNMTVTSDRLVDLPEFVPLWFNKTEVQLLIENILIVWLVVSHHV